MNDKELMSIIRDIVEEITGVKHLTPDTDFVKDLALNSFDIANLVCAFERRFDKEIAMRDAWTLATVQDVMTYIKANAL